MNDSPIHRRASSTQVSITAFQNSPIHLRASSTQVSITAFQTHLDGMCALINYCNGLVAGQGGGAPPGLFELTMHYRELEHKLRLQQEEVSLSTLV